MKGWIAVDFDGTLAVFKGNGLILGTPIFPMIARVKNWLVKGYDVRIFTSRVSFKDEEKNQAIREEIENWCVANIGRKLPVTCVKDVNMVELWDDKAVQVIKNTGLSLTEYKRRVNHTRSGAKWLGA